MSYDPLFVVGDIVRPRHIGPVEYLDVSAGPVDPRPRVVVGNPTLCVIDVSEQFAMSNVFVEPVGFPGLRWLFKSWDLARVQNPYDAEWPEFPIGPYGKVFIDPHVLAHGALVRVAERATIDVEALRERAKSEGATLPVGVDEPVNDWSTGFDENWDDHSPRRR